MTTLRHKEQAEVDEHVQQEPRKGKCTVKIHVLGQKPTVIECKPGTTIKEAMEQGGIKEAAGHTMQVVGQTKAVKLGEAIDSDMELMYLPAIVGGDHEPLG